jgi:hypothetical protein
MENISSTNAEIAPQPKAHISFDAGWEGAKEFHTNKYEQQLEGVNQKEIFDELLTICQGHYINDIRLLEMLMNKYTITRKEQNS